MVSLITRIFAVSFFINAAYALKCGKCEGNVFCYVGLTFDTDDCSEYGPLNILSSQCYKISGQTPDGKKIIQRGCLPLSSILNSGSCTVVAKTIGFLDGIDLDCTLCSEDYCNGIQTVFSILIIVAIVIVLCSSTGAVIRCICCRCRKN